MIILTGGAGFIGSNVLSELNHIGIDDVVIVDNIGRSEKWRYLNGLSYREYVHKSDLWSWLSERERVNLEGIIHLGACSDTTENDFDYLYLNNFEYSKKLWTIAKDNQVPFVYASSAATYGDGSNGFSDLHESLLKADPLNAYAMSKHLFDCWVLRQGEHPVRWNGLKYFNVFGMNEKHKGNMSSVALKGYQQIASSGSISLFKSCIDSCEHGQQTRDFIYVKDVAKITCRMISEPLVSGIVNVGTGKSTSFNELATGIFSAMKRPVNIKYVDMPETLQSKYQYHTKAETTKFREIIGKDFRFTELEDSLVQYVSSLA